MSKINKAVKRISEEILLPGFYLGINDKTVDKRSSFWREKLFPASQDIIHDKAFMFWHEFRKMHPTLMPTDICPCDEGDYISTTDSYESVMVSQAYWWLGYPVDCDWQQFLMPGEDPYRSQSFEDAIVDYMLDLREKLFEGFDQKEEYWSVLMATKGEIEIKPKGGKPYMLSFKRDDDLNCTITDPECQWCFDPKKGTTKANPTLDLQRMNDKLFDKNRGKTDLIVSNRTTCDWLRNVMTAKMAECKDVPTMQILFPHMIKMAGYDVPEQFDGADLAFGIMLGSRMVPWYCVETTFNFCDPDTGQEVCVNPLEDGKVYGYNISATARNTFGGRFAYGRIHNFHADSQMQKRFFHQHIAESGKSMKHHGESAPVVLIECPNSSWCLDVCGGNTPEVKKAKEAA